MNLRDTINGLVDILGCTRAQAKRIILAAYREGYAVAGASGQVLSD